MPTIYRLRNMLFLSLIVVLLIYGVIYLIAIRFKRNKELVRVPMENWSPNTTKHRLLPAFCARCSSHLRHEATTAHVCDLFDNNDWVFGKPSNSNLQPWLRDNLQQLPILVISKDRLAPKLLMISDLDRFDDEASYYFRYLTNDMVLNAGLQNVSIYWRMPNHSGKKPLVDLISRFEKRVDPSEIKNLWHEGEKRRFQQKHPWYRIMPKDFFGNEIFPQENYSHNAMEPRVAASWETLVNWTRSGIEIGEHTDGTIPHSYIGYKSIDPLRKLLEKYGEQIKGRNGIVVGSYRPWLEYESFRAGAAHVTTDEYLNLTRFIKSDHPRMAYVHPKELERKMSELGDQFVTYDFAMTYSSLEHSGLGRYGDPLNPDGDLMEMAKLACLVKPGGLLFLGLPTGGDCLQFNMHRNYGLKRYPLMGECWRLIEYDSDLLPQWDEQSVCQHPNGYYAEGQQPWFIFQNLRGCAVDTKL